MMIFKVMRGNEVNNGMYVHKSQNIV